MVKKGQAGASVLVGFIVLIILLAVVAFFGPPITGRVVEEIPDEEEETVEEERVNYLGRPFELRAWVINDDGVRLDIHNSGLVAYSIRTIEVKGCGTESFFTSIASGSSEIFSVDCALPAGGVFRGEVVLIYTTQDGEAVVVSGLVEDIV